MSDEPKTEVEVKLTKRERLLVSYGLVVLENQCFNAGGDLHPEVKDELEEGGGVPDHDETRALMRKIEGDG